MSEQPYYVPESSKLPFLMALTMLVFIIGASQTVINLGNPDSNAYLILVVFFLMWWAVMFFWFSEVIKENQAGLNNKMLKDSYVYGMAWFIFSEVMFFFAFFFALAYVRNFAIPWLGGEGEKGISNILWPGFEAQWPVLVTPDQALFPGPQQDMSVATAYSHGGLAGVLGWLPLWNTIFLLSSSVTVHIAHLGLKNGNRKQFNIWLGATLVLGYLFVAFQALEYYEAYAHMGLTLNTGIYGTTFFMLTGFHGFHVCLGAIILTIMLLRSLKGHFTADDHFGFEAGSWYWHFVDVVWVCLVAFVYVM
ncbi:MAG: cytochrome c oxidase subunit 3 [Euryarchaeota archaeon]|nr:cytochrome c oxidase subunit 3 [Euryarchaeota archaeon]|tara:strand:- start:6000 stop:6917 length:918 start_codon:yes stop_codon:yes gene_type:complete